MGQYGHYPPSSPPPYSLPPPRRGLPPWAWWLGACCILPLLGGLGLAIFGVFKASRYLSGEESIFASGVPKAKTSVGQSVAWVKPDTGLGGFGQLEGVFGDFDGDGRTEALLSSMTGMNPADVFRMSQHPQTTYYTYQLCLVDAEGRVKKSGTNDSTYAYSPGAWDYDGDGRDEIVSSGTGQNSTQILDGHYKVITSLAGETAISNGYVRDVNADGSADLFLTDSSDNSVVVYGRQGKELWRLKGVAERYNPGFGDVDGDGKTEVIFASISHDGKAQLHISGLGQNDQELKDCWPGYFWPGNCFDVDGDGRDEVFAAGSGYYNPASGAFTAFQYPAGYVPEDPSREVLQLDFDGDGDEDYATGGNNYSMDSALFVFDAAGSCIYYEELGDVIEDKAVLADDSGKEHLALLTSSKLLITP